MEEAPGFLALDHLYFGPSSRERTNGYKISLLFFAFQMKIKTILEKKSHFWSRCLACWLNHCYRCAYPNLEISEFEAFFWLLTPASRRCRPWEVGTMAQVAESVPLIQQTHHVASFFLWLDPGRTMVGIWELKQWLGAVSDSASVSVSLCFCFSSNWEF